jgi:hypothetical protein
MTITILNNILDGKYILRNDEFDENDSFDSITKKYNQKIDMFKLDLETELNTTYIPKKDKLFSTAWELADKSDKNIGLESVYNYYTLLVDLIR